MNVTAHRSISPVEDRMIETDSLLRTGTKPPPKHLSARALTALVSRPPGGIPILKAEESSGPLVYPPGALAFGHQEQARAGLWRVIAEKHPEIWDVIGGDPSRRWR
jgi:hypothetical protein